MRVHHEYTADYDSRFKYAVAIILLFILIVVARLYYLQVIRGAFYENFSAENSIKEIKKRAPRGMMFDRRGQVLVDNRPSFNIVVIPQYVKDPDKTFNALSRLLKIPREDFNVAWGKRKRQQNYQPLIVKADVTFDEVSLLKSHKDPWTEESDDYDFRGVDVEVQYLRAYPGGNIASHVLGYISEVNPKQLERQEKEGRLGKDELAMGDFVGVRGIEEVWDHYLRGEDGSDKKIVDAKGRQVNYEGISSQLTSEPAIVGNSLKLTLDRDLQEIVRDLFGTRKGGFVAMDVRTGAILAMYSSPSYDLNRMAGAERANYFQQIMADPEKVMLNRAIQGAYPPGSTYKIVNAVAALSEGVVKPDEKLNCGGALMFGGRAYHCFRKSGHGGISLHDSIVRSCDIYYYLAGLRLGVDRLAKYANMFGLGRRTGIPLADESPGLIPSSEWKLKRYGIEWQKGETISISVGQGYDTETPVQNALVAAQMANGGKKLELHLVDSAFDVDGNQTYEWKPKYEPVYMPIDPKIMTLVREAMVGVVAEPGGTGHSQVGRKVTMGGKTGTAQVVSLDGNAVCRGDKCKDHAWFIGFAPADAPEIAAAAIVEHGGFGAAASAPIVGAVLERYYQIEHGLPLINSATGATKVVGDEE